MNDSLRISVRRFDGAWRVFATPVPDASRGPRFIEGPEVHFERSDDERSFEYVHRDSFRDSGDAGDFARDVRQGLRQGRDLNLRFWSYAG